MNEQIRDHVLAAVGFARRLDSPVLGALLGVHRAGDALGLAYPRDPLVGPTELGVLIDVSLGTVPRGEYGLDVRVVTASMDLALSDPFPLLSELQVIPDVGPTVRTPARTHVSTGRIPSADRPAGTCSGTFIPQGGGHPPLPWEIGERPSAADRIAQDALSADEQLAIGILDRCDRAPGSALVEAATDGLVLHPTTVMANRAGVVQGGVLFGFAVQSGLPTDPLGAVFAHVDFLAPATINEPVRAEVTVVRNGRRNRLAHVELHQHDRLVLAAAVRCEISTNS